MGFTDAKKKVLECLDKGYILHEARGHINANNLLKIGDVSVGEVKNIIGMARGGSYSTSPHHCDEKIDVHIIKTNYSNKKWYIKWYFLEEGSIFISVHN